MASAFFRKSGRRAAFRSSCPPLEPLWPTRSSASKPAPTITFPNRSRPSNSSPIRSALRRGQPSQLGNPFVVVDDLVLDTGSRTIELRHRGIRHLARVGFLRASPGRENNGASTGLGLSIAAQAVAAQNRPQGGLHVTISLRCRTQAQLPPTRRSPNPPYPFPVERHASRLERGRPGQYPGVHFAGPAALQLFGHPPLVF
jgi:hypothetical protein